MTEGLTKTEAALLQALQRERLLLQQRDWVSGIILHELSNAAMVIGTSVDLMQMSDAGSKSHAMSVQRLQAGTAALKQMLMGLSVLIDSTGSLAVYESSDVIKFARSIVGDPMLSSYGDAARVRIAVGCSDLQWRICTSLLRHALGNLVRNALRYSSPGTPIHLAIGARGRRHWISIANKGEKIPEKIAAHLFEPGKKTASGGMGLGLYIAQTCVNRMDGRLVFGSTKAGTVFAIIFDEFVSERVETQGEAQAS